MTVVPSAARPATMSFWGLHTLPDGGFNAEHARRAVQEAVDKAASEISETPPEITVSVATGEATEELVAASRDADLLVVGSRGTGTFTRLLLGSVSSQVVHHAACPVTVIPPRARDAEEAPGSAHPAGDVGPGAAVARVLEELGGPVVLDEHARPGVALPR